MQLADYAMIANSIKNDLQTPLDNEQQQATIANLAEQGNAMKMQNKQKSQDMGDKSMLSDAIKKHASYNHESGKVDIDHDSVTKDLADSGRPDLAYTYQLSQHEQELKRLDADNKFAVNALAAAINEPDQAKKNMLWQSGIQHLQERGHDMSGLPSEYDDNTAKQMYGEAIGAQALAKQHLDEIKAQTTANREEDYSRNVDSLAGRRNAQNQHLTVGDAASMTPEDHNFYGEQYAKGDVSVLRNMSKSDAAATRQAARKYTQAGGGNADDQTQARIDNAADKRGNVDLAAREAKIAPRVQEARNMIPLALQASNAFERSDFRPLAAGENWWAKQTNNPKQLALNAATNSFINSYDAAVTGATGGTVSGKEHAREMLNTVQSQDGYKAVMDQLDKEMQAALDSPRQVRDMMAKHTKERNNKSADTGKATAESNAALAKELGL